MILPEPLHDQVEQVLGPIRGLDPVHGGCINEVVRVRRDDRDVLLKYGRSLPVDFYTAEAEGLRCLRAADSGLCVPAVESQGHTDDWSWLALEWLEPARGPADLEVLGRGLARLHDRADTGWGWERDGYIGTLRQWNGAMLNWAEFWLDRRLEQQLQLAVSGGLIEESREWSELKARLPEILAPAEEDGPSLLHGDLWSGNVLWTTRGPALIDPACYRGHREVDLAMMELFGGFGPAFLSAYTSERPLQPRYEARIRVYQLYYLMAHVNLFGSSYVSPTLSTLRLILKRA